MQNFCFDLSRCGKVGLKLRMLVSDVLEELGYGVIEAEDGPSAMKVLNSPMHRSARHDVGLLNVMNGRRLRTRPAARGPD